MIVTKIQPVNQKKSKIFIDGEFAFVLDKGEIFHWNIVEEESLQEEVYAQIREVVLERSKIKAMDLLLAQDRTRHTLLKKLKQAGFCDEIACEAISYVEKFHYIDDVRYASNYIYGRKNTKSIRQMKMELMQKGVSGEDVNKAFEGEEVKESYAIQNWIRKKKLDTKQCTKEELQKFVRFLLQRGFSYETIRKELQDVMVEFVEE